MKKENRRVKKRKRDGAQAKKKTSERESAGDPGTPPIVRI
jgi:hypothetical protein